MSKLIVIRGNSGSGKTSTAHRLREAILASGKATHVAVVEQDHFRRIVLREREADGSSARDLIQLVATFALDREYDVIVEGILAAEKYGAMIRALLNSVPESYAFYLDVPFEETVRRHASKTNAHEFGEADMRAWWLAHDVLDVSQELVIGVGRSMDELVQLIMQRVGYSPV